MNKEFFNPVADSVASAWRLCRLPASGVILHTQRHGPVTLARYQPPEGMPEWRILEPENPIPMDRIELVRAEGPTFTEAAKVCRREKRIGNKEPGSIFEKDWEVSPLINASSTFLQWGFSAPKNGGYDKCDFTIHWLNGESYKGRFDLTYGGLEAGRNFCESFRHRLLFYSGLAATPSHIGEGIQGKAKYHAMIAPIRACALEILGSMEI